MADTFKDRFKRSKKQSTKKSHTKMEPYDKRNKKFEFRSKDYEQ